MYNQIEAKTASINLTYLYFQTFGSFALPYFNSNILYSFHLFCIWWFFVIYLFSNILNSFEYLIYANIPLPLKTRTNCWFHCVNIFCMKVRFCKTFTVMYFKTGILLIEIMYKFGRIKCWSTLYLRKSVFKLNFLAFPT